MPSAFRQAAVSLWPWRKHHIQGHLLQPKQEQVKYKGKALPAQGNQGKREREASEEKGAKVTPNVEEKQGFVELSSMDFPWINQLSYPTYNQNLIHEFPK